MVISSSEILAIVGVISIIIGIISLIISYLNNKAILKQSEKNLLLQLTHKDRNGALFDLFERITKNERYSDVKNSVKNFLDSVHGQFIPTNLREDLEKELGELESFCYQKSPYPEHQSPSDEEMKSYEKSEEEYMKSEEERKKTLTPEERFAEEFAEKFSAFREKMIEKIKLNFRKPET